MSAAAKRPARRVPALVWRLGLPILLGAALLVLVGLPARRDARRDGRLAAELEAGFAGMERWAIDGVTIERAVADHDEDVERRWRRLFPTEKGKDVLFLDLARIADLSGVHDFYLAEDEQEMGAVAETAAADAPAADAPPVDGMPSAAAVPTAEVSSYKVRTRFEADLRATARFLAGLEDVERALQVREIVIRESGRRLMVEMEMELYVSKEA